jgi:hypothetical protein
MNRRVAAEPRGLEQSQSPRSVVCRLFRGVTSGLVVIAGPPIRASSFWQRALDES